MAAPENDFRGQIKVFLPCWKNLSNLAFYICNDVELQSWSQCGTLSLGRQGILQSASSEAWFNMIFFHSPANDVAHVWQTMLLMFVVLWWPGGSTNICLLLFLHRIALHLSEGLEKWDQFMTCFSIICSETNMVTSENCWLFFFFLVGCCEQIGSGHPCISPGLGDALVVLKQICHRWNPGRHGLETSLAFWKMQSLENRLKFLRTSLQPLFLVKEVQECSNGPDVWCVFKCDSDNCDMKWFEYSSCGIVCIRLHCFFTKFCLHKSPSGPCRVTNR